MSAADLWFATDGYRSVLDALGAIVLIHTEMETNLLALLGHFLNVPDDVVGQLFVALTNRNRVDVIRRLASAEGRAPADAAAVEFAVRCFDICAENRNIVAHSIYERPIADHRHLFFKLPTSPGARGWHWALTEINLGETFLDTIEADRFAMMLWHTLREGKQQPLPERPAQPRKLSLFRLPGDQQDNPPSLRS